VNGRAIGLRSGHHASVRVLLCALLLATACKGEKKSSPSESATPTERDHSAATSSTPAPPPSLPKTGDPVGTGPAPKLEAQRDWNDPATREEWEEKREERRKRMEEKLDTNHDGVVSPEEHAERVKPMRDRLDQNGDGKLTPDEMAASERRMGFDDPATLDTNKDGEISLKELDTAMIARRQQMKEKWIGRHGGGGMGSDE
jgi:hypothetical protein